MQLAPGSIAFIQNILPLVGQILSQVGIPNLFHDLDVKFFVLEISLRSTMKFLDTLYNLGTTYARLLSSVP